jgi:hypothetical protein
MKRAFLILLFQVLLSTNLFTQVPLPAVWGTVYSYQTGALPGVTVSLAHPLIGRSVPSVTNMQGLYSFSNVPPQQQPYYIEAYWGNALIYRGVVSYQGGSIRFDIALP